MSKASISEIIRKDVDENYNFIDVNKDGVTFDKDYVSKTLPKGLTQQQFTDALNHASHITEVAEATIAEKATLFAKDNADFDSVTGRLQLTDRVHSEVKWSRQSTDSAGQPNGYGRVTTKLAIQSSDEHKANQVALEEFAKALLG